MTTFHLNVALLSFITGSVIPLLVALVTKLNARSHIKAIANVVLSVVAGTVAYLVEHNGAANATQLVGAVIAAYLASGVTYQNFWKPTGVAPKVAAATPNAGLG